MFSPGLRIYGLGGHRTLFTRTVYTTPTRQLGVVYQNTTGRPLIVLGGEESMSGTMIAYCDASNPPTATVVNEGVGFGNQWFPFCFIVPPNYYYEVVNPTGILQSWNEFQINGGSVGFSGELSGSRSVGSTYQNTSGKAMLVVVDLADSVPNELVSCICDSSPAPATTVSDYMVEAGGGSARDIVVMMVPHNYYYKITGASASVLHWNEYSLPFNAIQSAELAGAGRAFDVVYTNGSKNLWFIASGRTSSLGQISSAVSAGQNQIMISTWANDDVAAWGIAQPVELYYETAGFSSTLSHWFEYQLG